MALKIRPRPHVSGYVLKHGIFFSVLVYHPRANGFLLKTVPREEILKNAGFSFTCGRTQTEVFEYDDVIHYILLPSGWILSYFHRFSVFMWTGEKDSNTLRWDTYFLKTEKKISVLKISGYVWTAPKLELLFQIQLQNQFSKTVCCV